MCIHKNEQIKHMGNGFDEKNNIDSHICSSVSHVMVVDADFPTCV